MLLFFKLLTKNHLAQFYLKIFTNKKIFSLKYNLKLRLSPLALKENIAFFHLRERIASIAMFLDNFDLNILTDCYIGIAANININFIDSTFLELINCDLHQFTPKIFLIYENYC